MSVRTVKMFKSDVRGVPLTILMKFDVDDKNRCRLVCVKFHLNRCRFAAAVAKCLGGSLFCDTVYTHYPSLFSVLASARRETSIGCDALRLGNKGRHVYCAFHL